MQVSDFLRTLLERRGIRAEAEIAEFLEPDYELHTHDPFLLSGMDVAVERLLSAIEKNERIAIYADFDCDGIPGAAILSDFFRKIGYANFEVYLPHRDREGYGFHESAIEQLAERGVKLIITVDVGTNALESIRFAGSKGVDVIVTDHHEINERVADPVRGEASNGAEAVAVLNPKLAPYPFPDLCGAAVAFKLVQAALEGGRKSHRLAGFAAAPAGWEKWLLDLVAIATIADLVPLHGENRVLSHFGLRVLRKSPRPGILALCNRTRLRRSDLTEEEIAFTIAPRINAASRMGDPYLALKLLTTDDPQEAENSATELESLNAARKGAVAAIVRQGKKHVKERFAAHEKIVVLGNPEWKPAILGPAANSIMEERGGAVCLWGRDANGNLKGSCRSDGSVSIVELFSRAGDALVECGGHERSGGFTVSQEHVHHLPKIFAQAGATLLQTTQADLSANLPAGASAQAGALAKADALLTLPEISRELFAEVSKLAPFGIGNPKPTFLVSETIVTAVRRFGKENNHTEVMLECRRSGSTARAFDFFASPEEFSLPPAPGTNARVHATIERDTFRGGLALRILDVLAP